MERIYENAGFSRRQNISVSVLVVVIIYGLWELWSAFGSASGDSTAAMFGVLFVGGGLYGLKTTWDESRDLVLSFDADFAAGRGVASVWRPFSSVRIEDSLDRFRAWRHWVKVGRRSSRVHYLVVDTDNYPRPLYIELNPAKPVPDGFRRLAPEAMEDVEANTRPSPAGA